MRLAVVQGRCRSGPLCVLGCRAPPALSLTQLTSRRPQQKQGWREWATHPWLTGLFWRSHLGQQEQQALVAANGQWVRSMSGELGLEERGHGTYASERRWAG